jgi:tRNA1(Val) A37 N6-methylase TrmN6
MNCGRMSETVSDTTEDAFLGGRLLLRQPRSGHRAGHDAMLLAAACRARPGERVVEFGAGVGAAGLALAKRVGAIELTLIEITPALAALARHNAAANSIPAHVVVLDVTARAQELVAGGLEPDSVDAVLMNPPFNDPARHRASPDEARASAHVAKPAMLAQWIGAARRLLKSGGVLTLIWRAAGIAEALSAFDRGFGSLELLPVHSDPTKPAIRILIGAVKGGRAPTKIFPALMLNEGPAQPNKHVAEILAGQGVLPLARL